MKSNLFNPAWLAVALAMIFVAGCTSISLESNKDPASVRTLRRVFILISASDTKDQTLATSLETAFRECFTNATPVVEVAITSPLDLDEHALTSRMVRFTPDAVLTVSAKSRVVDTYGNYPRIVYDASLFDPIAKKRIWRASIENAGSTEVMDWRMREMAEKIVQQLHQDGFL